MSLLDKKQRLELLIKHFSNNKNADFAKLVGVSPQAISSWLSRQSYDTELLYAKCVGVSAHWLLTGEGDMLKNDSLIYIPPKKAEPTVVYRDNPEKDEIIQLQREQIQLLKEKLSQFDSPNLVDARFGDPALVAEPLNPTPKRATKRNI